MNADERESDVQTTMKGVAFVGEGPDGFGGSIDAFIESRARRLGNEAQQERNRIWEDSAQKYAAAKEEDRRTAWAEYHSRLATLHSALADEHAQQAAKLTERS